MSPLKIAVEKLPPSQRSSLEMLFRHQMVDYSLSDEASSQQDDTVRDILFADVRALNSGPWPEIWSSMHLLLPNGSSACDNFDI